MNSTIGKGVLSVLAATILCMIAIDFAEAQRRGGGGRGGGMHRGGMHRGGAAASGSFQRSRARPQTRDYGTRDRDFSRGTRDRNVSTSDRQANRDERNDQRQTDRDTRRDQGQDNRDDRWDQRQDNIDDRQDFAKEVHNDREEWYEDRWRGGTYISVSSWNTMSCNYTTVVQAGVTYYNCNGVNYERVYHGGQVVYVVSN